MEWIASPDAWATLALLTVMEIVLGIDNIVFISIITGRLPREQQLGARRLGLIAALVTRIILLGGIAWVAHLEKVLFTLVIPWTGEALVLCAGGVFLIWKATREIYEHVEHPESADQPGAAAKKAITLQAVVFQIMLLDMVFSLDSVITAVGMADHIPVMVIAVIIAMIVMIAFAGPVGDFVHENPSVRVLALAFLVLIGVTLVMEGTGQHVEKAYIYTAMGFSVFVQVLNLRRDRRVSTTPA